MRTFILLFGLTAFSVVGPALRAQLRLVEEGGEFAPENLASADSGAIPFASDQLPGFEEFHNILHLNDGLYGNSQSWIGGVVVPAFAGVNLGDQFTVSGIAFGRDNGGEEIEFVDRSLGTYVLQYTTVDQPDETVPADDWTTIGEVEYDGLCPERSWLRHGFEFDPVENVTGVRILVPATGLDGGTSIDEIEVYAEATGGADICRDVTRLTIVEEGGEHAPDNLSTRAGAAAFASSVVSSEFCFTDTFEFLLPVEEGGGMGDENLATMDGAVPIAIDSLEGFAIHDIVNLNDGVFGNSNSWIGNSGFPAFAGIAFDRVVTVESIAFGRDSTGTFADRSLGTYTLEVTDVDAPDETTPDEDWTPVAEFTYADGCPARPSLRHRYNFAEALDLTGIRLVVPGSGIAEGTCIDEFEVYGEPGSAGGGTIHPAEALNDGLYGDGSSWQAGEGDPAFAGIAFGGSFTISSAAFGRDNGGEEFAFTNRTNGTYTLQSTTAPGPDADTPDDAWQTIGIVRLSNLSRCPSRPSLRHRYRFDAVEATGLRILVPRSGGLNGAAIDEIEVYESAGEGGDICIDVRDPCSEPEQVLTLVQTGGFFDDTNLAFLPEVTPFVIDSLAGFPIHDFQNLVDGVYGNTNSWIGNSGNPAFAGLDLGGLKTIGSIAWGRDNGGEAQEFTDRALGRYCVEYTTVENPDENTPDTDWIAVGVVNYAAAAPPVPHLRHRWDFETPIQATAIRLVVPLAGIGGGTCIDELEIYEEACGDECDAGSLCSEDGDDLELLEIGGPFTTPALPFDAPTAKDGNLAAEADAVPFGTPAHEAPAHEISNLTDGVYGNDNSWLGVAAGEVSSEVYVGVYFESGVKLLGEIAIGRDNLGLANDRVFGCYTIQVSEDEFDPLDDAQVAGATWTTVGLAASHRSDGAPPGLRRRYALPNVRARAVRVLTAIQSAIDEIELFQGGEIPPITFRRGDSDASGVLNITDGIQVLNFLFLGGDAPPCLEAADADNSGSVNITDGIFVLNFLFLGGPPSPDPGPLDCGPDTDEPGSPGDLGCIEYDTCE